MSTNSPTIASHFLRHVTERPSDCMLMVRQSNQWRSITWQQCAQDVDQVIQSLENRVATGDRVAQIEGNSYRWIVVDLALQLLRAVHIPINPRRGKNQIEQILSVCEPKLIVQAAIFPFRFLHEFSPKAEEDESALKNFNRLNRLADQISHEELMSIIYTSGTTGEPRGVMLTVNNFSMNVRSLLEVSPVRENEIRICFLPLSHVFARTNDLYACIVGGCTLAIADSAREMFHDLQEVQPTFFNGVPYMFDKCVAELKRLGDLEKPNALKESLGGRIEAVNCGGAALKPEVESYFWEHDVPMLTGYGLTETSPVITASAVDDHRMQTVGKALPGVQIRIADDGEVLAAGANVMQGYFRDPISTAQVIRDGWFHTGDIGRVDQDGFLSITGRKKEMIVTSTGHNVVPTKIEQLIDEHAAVERSFVAGNDLPFLVALVFPNERGIALSHAELTREICNQTTQLADYEQIGGVFVLTEPFSVETGTLTEKGNFRRDAIVRRYAKQIAGTVRVRNA